MRLLPIAIAAFLLFPAIAGAQQISTQNYTTEYANSTVSAIASYVNSVNVSGYLIFYPNLTLAYRYLGMAQSNVMSDPNLAVFYAIKAQDAAQQQYSNINYYRAESLTIMAIVTIIAAMVLVKVMIPIPVKGKAKARSRGRGNGR